VWGGVGWVMDGVLEVKHRVGGRVGDVWSLDELCVCVCVCLCVLVSALQSAIRGRLSRRELQIARKAATKLQAVVRMRLAKKEYLVCPCLCMCRCCCFCIVGFGGASMYGDSVASGPRCPSWFPVQSRHTTSCSRPAPALLRSCTPRKRGPAAC
jgi:hypothetical protein